MPSRQKYGPRSRTLRGSDRSAFARELRALYEAGHSVRSLSELHGRSYGSTHALLREAGTSFRPPHRPRDAERETPLRPPDEHVQ